MRETISHRIKSLKCRECGAEYPLEARHFCEFCFGSLEVDYNYDFIKTMMTRKSIAKGPASIWRYAPLLPVEGEPKVNLEAGFTPLVRADRLAKKLGINKLYIKNDTANPTWSFKDRVVSVALSRAVEMGFDTAACPSTGNLANSVAAHAAHAGLKCYVFIPTDLEAGKVMSSLIYNPNLMMVDGSYDEINLLCAEIAGRTNWAFLNVNIRPYYSEGSKTMAYEVAEQLGWQAPDHMIIPAASGSLLAKVHKGFGELFKLGLIDEKLIRISAAQAEGCSPVASAYLRGNDFITPVKSNTIVKSLAIGNPADGIYAIDILKKTYGSAAIVTNEEMVNGIKMLAEMEGVFTEAAGGVTIGALKKLAQSGQIGKEETVVALITGIGLKTQETVVGKTAKPLQIKPNLVSFEDAIGQKLG